MEKNIPNFLTLCNLLCGCIAIVFAFEENLIWSAYAVGVACVFDFLDGLIAHALKVHSELGKQLDSLADMVSFGVVPGMIMFHMIGNSFSFPYIGFLITIFSAIRLAKFNLDDRQTDSFIGLPTPANTILIASLPLFIDFNSDFLNIDKALIPEYILIPLTFILSFLLIVPLPLFALKFKNFYWTDNKVRYIFLALAVALLIIFQFAGIPLIIILYIMLSVVNNLISKKKQE